MNIVKNGITKNVLLYQNCKNRYESVKHNCIIKKIANNVFQNLVFNSATL